MKSILAGLGLMLSLFGAGEFIVAGLLHVFGADAAFRWSRAGVCDAIAATILIGVCGIYELGKRESK